MRIKQKEGNHTLQKTKTTRLQDRNCLPLPLHKNTNWRSYATIFKNEKILYNLVPIRLATKI